MHGFATLISVRRTRCAAWFKLAMMGLNCIAFSMAKRFVGGGAAISAHNAAVDISGSCSSLSLLTRLYLRC